MYIPRIIIREAPKGCSLLLVSLSSVFASVAVRIGSSERQRLATVALELLDTRRGAITIDTWYPIHEVCIVAYNREPWLGDGGVKGGRFVQDCA